MCPERKHVPRSGGEREGGWLLLPVRGGPPVKNNFCAPRILNNAVSILEAGSRFLFQHLVNWVFDVPRVCLEDIYKCFCVGWQRPRVTGQHLTGSVDKGGKNANGFAADITLESLPQIGLHFVRCSHR